MIKLRNKNGVTNIFLAMGILLTIIITLFMGVRIFSVIVKQEPAVIAKEYSLTGMAALAAPEDAVVFVKAPDPVRKMSAFGGDRKVTVFFGKLDLANGKSEGASVQALGFWESLGASLKYVIPIYGPSQLGFDTVNFGVCTASEGTGTCQGDIGGATIKKAIVQFDGDAGTFVKGNPEWRGQVFVMRAHCDNCWQNKDYAEVYV